MLSLRAESDRLCPSRSRSPDARTNFLDDLPFSMDGLEDVGAFSSDDCRERPDAPLIDEAS